MHQLVDVLQQMVYLLILEIIKKQILLYLMLLMLSLMVFQLDMILKNLQDLQVHGLKSVVVED